LVILGPVAAGLVQVACLRRRMLITAHRGS
jgi:hypothetical protein